MFSNLIESSSHAREFKRRGSFFLYTIAAYSLLFVGGGVASIYAYDAHLDEQTQELTLVTFAPVPLIEIPPTPTAKQSPANTPSHSTQSTRPIFYDSAGDPKKIPEQTSVRAVQIPPARPESVIGPTVNDPPLPSGNPANDRDPAGGSYRQVSVEAGTPPPPPPAKKQTPQVIKISGVLNGRALNLPKPAYPKLAIQIHLSVQVLIDETGRVVSAPAVSGHPVLAPGAVSAAYQARFSPTFVGDTPVKVSGIITYNFVLQ